MTEPNLTTRIRPVCPTCGTHLGNKQVSFFNLLKEGRTREQALDELGFKNRICCRTRFLTPIQFPLGLSKDDPSLIENLNKNHVKINDVLPNVGALFVMEGLGEQGAVESNIPFLSTNFISGSGIPLQKDPTSPPVKIISITDEGRKTEEIGKFDIRVQPIEERRECVSISQ